jgi:hypothetical protein
MVEAEDDATGGGQGEGSSRKREEVSFNREFILKKLPDFVSYANSGARALFNRLDVKLDPRVIIVAVPFRKEFETVVTQPDSSAYDTEWFADVHDVIGAIPESYQANLAFEAQGVPWQKKVEVKRKLQKILNSKLRETGRVGFTTTPEFTRGYSVSLVIDVSGVALKSHHALAKNTSWGYGATSFIYETIAAFLYSCLPSLKELGNGRARFRLSENGDDVLRRAGSHLMKTVKRAVGNGGPENLFRACNVIASLLYEGDEGVGGLIVSGRGHPSLKTALSLLEPVRLSDYRRVRKLLEVASEKFNLLCDASGVYGFGMLNERTYVEAEEDLFTVKFDGHYHWRLTHAGKELMSVRYGLPTLPKELLGEEEFKAAVKSILRGIDCADLEKLWSLVKEAINQKRGTMIVISDKAAEESRRLRNQSSTVVPTPLTPELLSSLSSIDGAVLIDPHACCHAIGVILDGVASDLGSPARGARYNSAVRYLEYARSQQHLCIAVVISEDGTVDLLPTSSGNPSTSQSLILQPSPPRAPN